MSEDYEPDAEEKLAVVAWLLERRGLLKSARIAREAVVELARVTAERDRLIERWPDSVGCHVETNGDGLWRVYSGSDDDGGAIVLATFSDRTDAVRFAAGLDAEGGADG